MRRSKAGIEICPPSILAYNVMKLFGSKAMDLPARLVSGMLLVDDIVNEYGNQKMEDDEARAKVR